MTRLWRSRRAAPALLAVHRLLELGWRRNGWVAVEPCMSGTLFLAPSTLCEARADCWTVDQQRAEARVFAG